MSLPIAERLADRIRREGPLRFDDFQRAALYDPDGYYERAGRVGRTGDFVTGASWHPAFARCLTRLANRLLQELGAPLDVVDVGAGEGELLAVLAELFEGSASPGRNRSIRLTGVELSEVRRGAAKERAPAAVWVPAVGDLPDIRGLVIAYELFDALPVRALRVGASGELLERRVAVAADGSFAWVETACADSAGILQRLGERGTRLEPGQKLEVRPDAVPLARALASRLTAGILLVFDYGAPARALYSATARPEGTLEAFQAHRVSRDVLGDPGSRDITAWVDFTELEEAFASEGLQVHGLVSQSRFLAATGIAEELRDDPEEPVSAARAAERNAIGKLFAPGGMGESIRVLVASRGTDLTGELVRWPE